MKLVNKNESLVGGRLYTYEDSNGNKYQVRGDDMDWAGFERKIKASMTNNNVSIPENLMDYVIDQICTRQPPGKCFYEKKAGDQLTQVIHTFAKATDTVAKSLGITANLERKARGCSGCSKRRVKMNKPL